MGTTPSKATISKLSSSDLIDLRNKIALELQERGMLWTDLDESGNETHWSVEGHFLKDDERLEFERQRRRSENAGLTGGVLLLFSFFIGVYWWTGGARPQEISITPGMLFGLPLVSGILAIVISLFSKSAADRVSQRALDRYRVYWQERLKAEDEAKKREGKLRKKSGGTASKAGES